MALSPDGRLLASGSQDATVRLWDVTTGKELRALRGHEETVSAVAFSPDGKAVASCGYDKRAYLWDVATGKRLREFRGRCESGHSLAFSLDGKVVALGGTDTRPTSGRRRRAGNSSPLEGTARRSPPSPSPPTAR